MLITSFRIFESKLEYLESFESVLRVMESPISKSLLSIMGKDLDLSANFISLGGEDFVNFIPDKRSNEVRVIYRVANPLSFLSRLSVYDKVFAEYGMPDCLAPLMGDLIYIEKELDPDVLKRHFPDWEKTKIYHCKSLDGSKNHIYLPSEKSIEKQDRIIGPKPQQIKIGRLARNLLKLTNDKFSDKEIENFVNEFKSKYAFLQNAFRNFHLVTGDDIRHWYLEDNYYDSPNGPLHNSCMRYLDCQGFFSIYVDNPEVCQLLILKSDYDSSKITGRALVWKLENGDYFMDRIYFSKDSEVNLFIEFAKSNGWVYKSSQGTGCGLLIDGNKYTKIPKVKLTNFDFKEYPYVDTLCYLSEDGSLTCTRKSSKFKELRSTEGEFVGNCENCENGRVDCDSCGGEGNVDCYDCGGSGSIICSDCDGEGEIDCPDCDGSGDIDDESCGNCKGSGKITCDECNNGGIECGSCGGSGVSDCDDCGGSGMIDCPECT